MLILGWFCHVSCPDCLLTARRGVRHALPISLASQEVRVQQRMVTSCLQVGIVLVGEGHLGGFLHLLLVVLHGGLVDLDLWGSKGGCGDEVL
jgi:hypothetical protein